MEDIQWCQNWPSTTTTGSGAEDNFEVLNGKPYLLQIWNLFIHKIFFAHLPEFFCRFYNIFLN